MAALLYSARIPVIFAEPVSPHLGMVLVLKFMNLNLFKRSVEFERDDMKLNEGFKMGSGLPCTIRVYNTFK